MVLVFHSIFLSISIRIGSSSVSKSVVTLAELHTLYMISLGLFFSVRLSGINLLITFGAFPMLARCAGSFELRRIETSTEGDTLTLGCRCCTCAHCKAIIIIIRMRKNSSCVCVLWLSSPTKSKAPIDWWFSLYASYELRQTHSHSTALIKTLKSGMVKDNSQRIKFNVNFWHNSHHTHSPTHGHSPKHERRQLYHINLNDV